MFFLLGGGRRGRGATRVFGVDLSVFFSGLFFSVSLSLSLPLFLPLSLSPYPYPSLSLWLARHPARLFSLAWPRVFVCSHRRAARAFVLVPARLCLRARVLAASAVARASVAPPCNFPRL